jgi:phosphoribosylamine---glycine ligase
MKILVIGGGGREHALAWKLAQSPKVHKVFVAPGNGGTALDARFQSISQSTPEELRAWAATEKIALTVVGPEAPLAAGVVDEFRKHGLRIFGPTRAAAQLESSKAFSKAFMQRHGIPTAGLKPSPMRQRRMLMWSKRVHRSWSRPMAWPQARAWS